jgi:MFS family permease
MGAALGAYRLHVRSAPLVATCCVGFGMLFTNVAAYTYVNFYLTAPPFNLTPGQLGLVFTVYLLGIVTTTAATWLAVRIGRRATLVLATALAACGLLLTLMPRVAAVIGGLALMSGGLFVLQALSLGFIAAATRHAKSTAVGLYVSVYYIGGALGGILPGGVWSHAGWHGIVALLVTVLVATGSAGVLFWHDATRG